MQSLLSSLNKISNIKLGEKKNSKKIFQKKSLLLWSNTGLIGFAVAIAIGILNVKICIARINANTLALTGWESKDEFKNIQI